MVQSYKEGAASPQQASMAPTEASSPSVPRKEEGNMEGIGEGVGGGRDASLPLPPSGSLTPHSGCGTTFGRTSWSVNTSSWCELTRSRSRRINPRRSHTIPLQGCE